MAYRNIITDAIDRRKVLKLRYKDVDRTVRPHIFGIVGGKELALSAWQVSGTGEGWRLFHLNDISKMAKTAQSFRGTAPGYNPNDPAFSRILDKL